MAEDRTIEFEKLTQGCMDIEVALGLPSLCLVDLPQEKSDWSFVIKVAALVEAAITHLLAAQVEPGPIETLIGKLSMQGPTGKLPLAHRYDLITKRDLDFCVGVSQLRNVLAHDPQFLRFDFADYLRQLKGDKRKTFLNWATLGKERSADDAKEIKVLRLQIWAQAVYILAKAMKGKAESAQSRDLDRMYREIGSSVMTDPPSDEYI